MDDYSSQVYQAPLVVIFGLPGAAEYFQSAFPDKFLTVALQTRKVGIARYRGDNKKISPEIEASHVHDHYVPAMVAIQKFSQLQGHAFILQRIVH
jgi:hypothetical protein